MLRSIIVSAGLVACLAAPPGVTAASAQPVDDLEDAWEGYCDLKLDEELCRGGRKLDLDLSRDRGKAWLALRAHCSNGNQSPHCRKFDAARPYPMEAVMSAYCKAPAHNEFWCDAGEPRPRLARAQQWEIVDGYCFDHIAADDRSRAHVAAGASETLCDMLKKAEHPLTLVYHARDQRWEPGGGFETNRDRVEVDQDNATGKPTAYLPRGEDLGVVVGQLNAIAYRVERGETTERPVEGMTAIQTVLTSAGGTLSALAAQLARRLPDDGSTKPASVKPASLALGALHPPGAVEDVARAVENDVATLRQATLALQSPFNALRDAVDRLQQQLRRLHRLGRALNRGPAEIGRRFDTDIEDPSNWARWFGGLREAMHADGRNLAGCRRILEKFAALTLINPEQPADVYGAAIAVLEEFDPPAPGTVVAPSACPLPSVAQSFGPPVERLRTAAAEAAADVTRVAKMRERQTTARHDHLEPARVMLRHLVAMDQLREEIGKVLETENSVKQQAEVSRVMSDRARNASLRSLGSEQDLACGSPPLPDARAMSLRVVAADPTGRPATVTLVLSPAGRSSITVPVTIPAGAVPDTLIPVGIADVDRFLGCGEASETSPDGSWGGRWTLVAHEGFLVSNRIFVHERLFTGALTKVRTERIVMTLAHADDQKIVIDGPSKLEATYDVARRGSRTFGASVGVLAYTPLRSRTYALIDPTPDTTEVTQTERPVAGGKTTTTTPESKLFQQQNADSRAGLVAAFLNWRVVQALSPGTRTHPIQFGLETGFGVDVSKPAFLAGVSAELFKYIRLGGGFAAISAADTSDPGKVNTLVPAAYVIPTETRLRRTWYASFTFALDSLNLFSK